MRRRSPDCTCPGDGNQGTRYNVRSGASMRSARSVPCRLRLLASLLGPVRRHRRGQPEPDPARQTGRGRGRHPGEVRREAHPPASRGGDAHPGADAKELAEARAKVKALLAEALKAGDLWTLLQLEAYAAQRLGDKKPGRCSAPPRSSAIRCSPSRTASARPSTAATAPRRDLGRALLPGRPGRPAAGPAGDPVLPAAALRPVAGRAGPRRLPGPRQHPDHGGAQPRDRGRDPAR